MLLLREALTNEIYGSLSVRNDFDRSKDDDTSSVVALTSDDQIVAFDINSEIKTAPKDIFKLH